MGCPANLSGLHVHSREAAGRRWCRCGHSRPADTTPVDLQRVRQALKNNPTSSGSLPQSEAGQW